MHYWRVYNAIDKTFNAIDETKYSNYSKQNIQRNLRNKTN